MENPEIRHIEATGWPRGANMENEDTREARLEFAADNLPDLLEYLAGYPEILDDFVQQYNWRYRAWLN